MRMDMEYIVMLNYLSRLVFSSFAVVGKVFVCMYWMK
jgi:hypothetical protein